MATDETDMPGCASVSSSQCVPGVFMCRLWHTVTRRALLRQGRTETNWVCMLLCLAVVQVAEQQGKMSTAAAENWVKRLGDSGRYHKDVW